MTEKNILFLLKIGILLLFCYSAKLLFDHFLVLSNVNIPDNIVSIINEQRFCSDMQQINNYAKRIKNNRIAIITAVSKESDYDDYDAAIKSIQCYADHYGYHFEMINMTTDSEIVQKCPHEDVS